MVSTPGNKFWVYLSMSPFPSLSLFLSIFLSVCLLLISLSLYLSPSLFLFYLYLFLYLYLYIYLSINLSIYIYLSINLSLPLSLSTYFSIDLSERKQLFEASFKSGSWQHQKRRLNVQKWSEHVVIYTILTSKCASRHSRVHSWTPQGPKVLRAWCVFSFFTWKCALASLHFDPPEPPFYALWSSFFCLCLSLLWLFLFSHSQNCWLHLSIGRKFRLGWSSVSINSMG